MIIDLSNIEVIHDLDTRSFSKIVRTKVSQELVQEKMEKS